MSEQFYNGVFGQVLNPGGAFNSPLTFSSGSTQTGTFSGLGSTVIPAIASGDWIRIVVEPGTANEEVMLLLGPYTAGALSGTFLRAFEASAGGVSSGIAHTNAAWVHAVSATSYRRPRLVTIFGTGVETGNVGVVDASLAPGISAARSLGAQHIDNFSNDGAELCACGMGTPSSVSAAVQGSGSVGANLSPSTNYSYILTLSDSNEGYAGNPVDPQIVNSTGRPGWGEGEGQCSSAAAGNQGSTAHPTIITWTNPAGEYGQATNIYRQTGGTGPYYLIARTGSISTTSFTDNGNYPPQTYQQAPSPTTPTWYNGVPWAPLTFQAPQSKTPLTGGQFGSPGGGGLGWLGACTGKGGWKTVYDKTPRPSLTTGSGITGGTATATYPPTPAGLFILNYSVEDLQIFQGAATFTTIFTTALQAVLSRIRAAYVMEDTDASIAYAGSPSWAQVNTAIAGSGEGYTNNATAGATATISVPSNFQGGTILLGLVGGLGTSVFVPGCGYTVKLDGVTVQTGTTQLYTSTTGMLWEPYQIPIVLRLTGVSAGVHTIVLTITSGSGTGFLAMDWWGVEANPPPPVVVVGPYRLPGTGVINPTNVTSLISAVQTLLSGTFDSYVGYVNAQTVLNSGQSSLFENGYGFYPNEVGCSLLAAEVTKIARSLLVPNSALAA